MWLEVTLKSSAGEIELSTVGGASGVFLLDGVRGFGLPEREIESTPLPAVHGSVFRSTRFGESEMMLPVAFRDTDQSQVSVRVREFERVLVPASSEPVELIVRAPELGTVRRRWCYYVDGLQGGLGGQDSHVWWRHCAVKLLALDPLWFGVTRVQEQRVAAARKAFITGADPRVQRVNLAENPTFSSFHNVVLYRGQSHTRSLTDTEGIDGGSGLILTAKAAGSGGISTGLRSTSTLPPASLFAGRVMVRASAPMSVEARFSRQDTPASEWAYLGTPAVVEAPAGEWVAVEARTDAAHTLHKVSLDLNVTSPDGGPMPIGESITVSQLIIEAGTETGEFFSGDTPDTSDPDYRWEGAPGRTPSVADGRGASHAYPFFPVMLSDSTVQGAQVINIQGDAEAWPVWEVTGPGEDLLIQNDDTGERIFIRGQFGEKVTITTRPQEQDVTSGSAMDGSLWERVSEDSTFFPLKPGINRIRMSMVNGKPESTVTLKYVEQWLAGF
ncbi:phage distal tail protein [Brevibacterium otitidis]|uniref:Siphovirus-type tail component C-terminal domain-containing protein n=1 Tax=Brevibacterium otitidis TaxID=53364 RepID=A0ABV5X0Y6_9MICO|nr:hypothetical protein GCM10023233_05020 [Brevibacterium otitidis]